MNQELSNEYNAVRENGVGFHERKRGLIAVYGKEAVQFLNGLITNDVAKLESDNWISAAFPNAQGRLLAVVRVLRFDERFLFETEAATHEKVFQNLFRFTYAGDFFVEDLTGNFSFVAVRGKEISNFKYKIPIENEIVGAKFAGGDGFLIRALRADGFDVFVPNALKDNFVNELENLGAIRLGEEAQEILRVENGVPKYGVDMDETTIVPELGIENIISYNKGCYIGQEIIARIHFRGHVAKQLTGLVLEAEARPNDELKSPDGKNAGRVTSAVFSPALDKFIALAFVRYDYLAEGTELKINESKATVKHLPFID